MNIPYDYKSHYSIRNKEIEFYKSIDDWWSPNGPQG